MAALLEEARIEMDMPGLRAAVRLSDGRIVRAAVGLADKEAGIPLDNEIGMPGGSTGKAFVAALTMLLVEDGKLSLDDPVSKWLSETSWYERLPNADGIRVRHLLSHSAGIKDYIETAGFHFSMIGRVVRNGSAYYEPEELIEFVLDKRPLFAPGEGFHYTDVGYLLLGRLIEAASAREFYDLLDERILVPQGLDQVRPADTAVLENITPGYMGGSRNLREDGRMKFDPRSEWTGGGLITNPTMLVRFFAALADGQVVKPESFKKMLESGWQDPDEPGGHYGFGVAFDEVGESFGHGGLWPGYRSHATHYLSDSMTIAVQTNRDGRLDLEALVARIAVWAKSAGQNGQSVIEEITPAGP
ncbi:MAG: beta-lactamase family protein [Xanthomonadales bacterium]|nr:beta-lactamase family protein [Xanthomonadales bacterium]